VGEQIIQLPADSTGKKVRTQERTVGANTVQEQYVIVDSPRVRTGGYHAHTGNHTIQAAATNGTSTGFWWFYNPVGSTQLIEIVKVTFSTSETTALANLTSPRVLLSGFTFTGTPGGAAITPKKVDTTDPAATAILMTTQVTSVVALTQAMYAHLAVCVQSGSSGGPGVPSAEKYPDDADLDMRPVLRAGEGIVCYQPDAGVASDTRKLITNLMWKEYTVP